MALNHPFYPINSLLEKCCTRLSQSISISMAELSQDSRDFERVTELQHRTFQGSRVRIQLEACVQHSSQFGLIGGSLGTSVFPTFHYCLFPLITGIWREK